MPAETEELAEHTESPAEGSARRCGFPPLWGSAGTGGDSAGPLPVGTCGGARAQAWEDPEGVVAQEQASGGPHGAQEQASGGPVNGAQEQASQGPVHGAQYFDLRYTP